ncbi:MAG: hypothetical protein RBU30_11730 [Polyangia bacterium]|nr:hypothetical protein [Polyangia bacterium]
MLSHPKTHPGLVLLQASLLAFVAGCPKTQPATPPRPATTGALAARLMFPPDQGAEQALVELERRGAATDRQAAWEAARYLFDLYDFARLTGDAPARAWLWKALALPGAPGRGAAATRQVLELLERRIAGLPSGVGGKGPAALSALIASDRAFLAEPSAFPRRVATLRALRDGPLGYAAELRLYALGAQSFRAAVLAPPETRPLVLNHCLYALYDMDAAPHLRAVGRAPDPPWNAYREGLAAILERVGAAGHRQAELASRLLERDRRFYASNLHALPLAIGAQVPRLPRIAAGRPFGGGAAVLRLADQVVIGGRGLVRPEARDFRVALSRLFFAHGQRTHLTLFGPEDLDTRHLKELLERAADTGFYTLGLGGGKASTSREGYWASTGKDPLEPRELVVSLAPSSEAARTLTNLGREELQWDRGCARHGIGLILRQGEVVAAGPEGRLEPIRPIGSLSEAAVSAVSGLHRAFPGACGLWVAAEPGVTYGELIRVAERLLGRDRPELQAFSYLGLLLDPPGLPPSGNAFPQRVQQRLKARVALASWPRRLASSEPALVSAIRPCYLDALDILPTRWARLDVVSTPEKTLVSQPRGTSPEEERLNACVSGAVEAWRRGEDTIGPLRFQVDLKP